MASNKIRSRIIYRYDIVVSTVEEYIQKINGQRNIIQRIQISSTTIFRVISRERYNDRLMVF